MLWVVACGGFETTRAQRPLREVLITRCQRQWMSRCPRGAGSVAGTTDPLCSNACYTGSQRRRGSRLPQFLATRGSWSRLVALSHGTSWDAAASPTADGFSAICEAGARCGLPTPPTSSAFTSATSIGARPPWASRASLSPIDEQQKDERQPPGFCSSRRNRNLLSESGSRGSSGWEVGGGCAAVLGIVAWRGAGDLRDRPHPRRPVTFTTVLSGLPAREWRHLGWHRARPPFAMLARGDGAERPCSAGTSRAARVGGKPTGWVGETTELHARGSRRFSSHPCSATSPRARSPRHRTPARPALAAPAQPPRPDAHQPPIRQRSSSPSPWSPKDMANMRCCHATDNSDTLHALSADPSRWGKLSRPIWGVRTGSGPERPSSGGGR